MLRLSALLPLLLLLLQVVPPVYAAEQGRTITRKTEHLVVTVQYPVLGNATIDAESRQWAERQVQSFDELVQAEEPTGPPYELRITYTLSQPSQRALSIGFDIWEYTGGAHGNLYHAPRTYDLTTAQQLDLQDIFTETEQALNRMSSYCYAELAAHLGDMRVEDMLRSGTSPDFDNFSAFLLTPDGIRILFAPYQVAPYAAGPQKVDIPLSELIEAGPRLELWSRK